MKITVETTITTEHSNGEKGVIGKVTLHTAGDNPRFLTEEVKKALDRNTEVVKSALG